jgi:hypothetical protein
LAALDDFFRLHESLSHAMSRWFGYRRRHQTLRHLDDVLVALYGLGALAMAWYHRNPLLAMRWTVLCFALAGLLFGVMVWLDLMRLSYAIEDSLKILAGAVILAGLLHPLFARRASRRRTAPGADRSSAAPAH